MTTRTYATVMTGLSFVGLIAMLVAMSTIEKLKDERQVNAAGPDQFVAGGGLDVKSTVTDFELENQLGAKVDLESLKGTIWVADFMFTSCAGICPTMSKHMGTVQEAFAGNPEVKLVSISVDPETDTVERLQKYGERFEADPEQWQFLRGDIEEVHALAREGMLIGNGDEAVNHSPRFVLVDREGQVREYYFGTDVADIDRLIGDIRTLLGE